MKRRRDLRKWISMRYWDWFDDALLKNISARRSYRIGAPPSSRQTYPRKLSMNKAQCVRVREKRNAECPAPVLIRSRILKSLIHRIEKAWNQFPSSRIHEHARQADWTNLGWCGSSRQVQASFSLMSQECRVENAIQHSNVHLSRAATR